MSGAHHVSQCRFLNPLQHGVHIIVPCVTATGPSAACALLRSRRLPGSELR